MSNGKNTVDILNEYKDSANKNKASLAGSMLDQYKNIQDNTLNAKNEAYQAQLNAMKYSNNVLKNQGLANTGMAQSNAQNISNNYMNALNNVNATKLQAEKDLLSDYRNSLAGIERQDDSNAYSRYESLLPYYMEDETKLNEYMAKIDADTSLSDSSKQNLRDYVNAMQIQKDSLTDPNEWKSSREDMLDDVEKYLDKGKIDKNKLSKEDEEKLGDLYNALLNSKDAKEADKTMKAIETFVEEFSYTNNHKQVGTTNALVDKMSSTGGEGTLDNPYQTDNYGEFIKLLENDAIPHGSYVKMDGNIWLIKGKNDFELVKNK